MQSSASTEAKKVPKYSVSWAEWVAKNLREKYPRATGIALHWLDINEHQWALFLAYADPVWSQIRYLIKMIDSLQEQRGFGTDWKLVKYCAKCLHGKGYERLAVRLDKHFKNDTQYKSKVEAEGAPGAASSAPGAPDVISGG